MPKKYRPLLGVMEYYEDEWVKTPPLIWVKRTNRTESADTLLHEYSHVVDLHRNGCVEGRAHDGHDTKFRDVQYEIYIRFVYEGGDIESKDF